MAQARGDRLIGQLPAHNLAKENKNLKKANDAIKREKQTDARKFDRLRDRARTADTKVANRKEEFELDEKKLGLWDRIRAKKASGRKMNPKGHKDAPTDDEIRRARGNHLKLEKRLLRVLCML